MNDIILQKLECFNDPDFKFDPYKHKYTYHGDTFRSVTQYISDFQKKFDSEYQPVFSGECSLRSINHYPQSLSTM